jgi:hypothetical protein
MPGSHARLKLTSFLLFAFLISACGTLDLDVEAEPPAERAGASASPSNARPVTNPMMTPTNTPVFRPLTVAFQKDDDLWLWSSERGEGAPLTAYGDVNQSRIKLSDDGRLVVFTRGLELWVARTDGSGAHRLLAAGELDYLDPAAPGISIYHYEWVPGQDTLAFNTRQRIDRGTLLYDDLHLIDAETLERRELFSAGQGGEFTYSPDGRQIALVRPGIISLVDADGSNRREAVLTYTPARYNAEEQYYARPVWSSSGQELLVPILPADPLARPVQQTTIWRVPAGNSPAELVANLRADPFGRFILAPDQGLVAYLSSEDEANEKDLLITELSSGETIIYAEDVFHITSNWSPGASQFTYLPGFEEQPGAYPQAQVAQPGHQPATIDTSTGSADQLFVTDVRWLDDNRFLALGRPPTAEEWLILLGHPGSAMQEIATINDTPGSDVPSYDFSLGD